MKTIQVSDEAHQLLIELQQTILSNHNQNPYIHAVNITPHYIVPSGWGDETIWVSEDCDEKYSSEELFDHLYSDNPEDLYVFCQEELKLYPPMTRDSFAEALDGGDCANLNNVFDYKRMGKLYYSSISRLGAFSLFKSDIEHNLKVNSHHYYDLPTPVKCVISSVPKMEALLTMIKTLKLD